MTRTEGNVIHADFGRKADELIDSPLPQMSFTCEVLYEDQFAKLIRMTYRVNGQHFIQHIASGVGLDA